MSCISWFKALLFITRVPGDIWSRGKKKDFLTVKKLKLWNYSQCHKIKSQWLNLKAGLSLMDFAI